MQKNGFTEDLMEFAFNRGFVPSNALYDEFGRPIEEPMNISQIDEAIDYLNAQECALGSNEKFIFAEFGLVIAVPTE